MAFAPPNKKKIAWNRKRDERRKQEEAAYEQHTPIQVMKHGKKKRVA